MQLDYDALIKKGIWFLVPPPSNKKVISKTWVFQVKKLYSGNLDKRKSRVLAKSFN